ncbi:MAG TPA: hypothetical protein IAB67_05455 [Candidatus Ventrousia excrementavium]|uniref:Uncharacterized protein n=1 Tax=Candidatus Ventrousia excrementavium TaxID=2840961 RepID=A0A9D1IUS1_9CLOT|nr:hypothetical protein [Candidatus Ventrousia excrementavium]
MLILLGTTLTTSFFDCLNPSAIAQQMMLQAMVNNKRHTLFFIFGIGSANLAMGLAIYYGIAAWVTQLLSSLTAAYPLYVYGLELAAGFLCLGVGIRLFARVKRSAAAVQQNLSQPAAQLTPLSLFVMGAAFCFIELTSALPYFGFLAVLSTYHYAFPLVLAFIVLYDFVYVLPLVLVYLGYNRLRGTAFITRLENVLSKVSSYIVPGAVGLLSVFLIFHSTSSLL